MRSLYSETYMILRWQDTDTTMHNFEEFLPRAIMMHT